jgi:hypothetical protein
MALIINKLLKTIDAHTYQNAAYAVLEYATSTRDFGGNASRARSFFDLGKTADRLTER